jgi:hypothetical protein
MSADPGKPVPPQRPIRKGILVKRPACGRNKVYFIRHALDRMKQRRITEDEVFKALRNPSQIGLRTQLGRKRVRWRRNKAESVDVVYEVLSDSLRIITVMVISQRAQSGIRNRRRRPKRS